MVTNSNLGNRGFLQEKQDEEGLYPIYGIAIGNNDVTVGQKSGEPKLWRPDVLEASADTLEGRDIVVNHENRDAYEVIGEVTESKYSEGEGVIYKGVIDSEELARKIEHGWLEVSPRIFHSKKHEMVKDVKVPESIRKFDNLSIVQKGAAQSNEVEFGQTDEFSVEELQESFDGEEEDEISEYQHISDVDDIEEFESDGVDYSQWMYKDREGAEGASEKFGCGGSHEHTVDGEKWYVPCRDHDTFLKNLKQSKSENMSLSAGDYVSWSSGKGRIIELSDSDVYDEDIENERVEGEEDNPAVLIEEFEESGDSWISSEDKVGYNYSELNEWDAELDDDVEVEELQLSEARDPSYDETETISWEEVPADQLEYYVGSLGYEGVEAVGDLTDSQKEEIASYSLLGDPRADNIRSLRFFPVVNADTGDLNRGALEAVRGGRGQSADVSDSAYESAFAKAGTLLNQEFGSDVETDIDEMSVEELQSPREEKKRLAGQISSWALLTRDEAVDLLTTLDPDSTSSPEPLKKAIVRAFDDVSEEEVNKVLRVLGLEEREGESTNRKMQLSEGEEEKYQELSKVVRAVR